METRGDRALPQEAATQDLSMDDYLQRIRTNLDRSLCIQDFPCQDVERHSRPEVEFQSSAELILEPVLIRRDKHERCLIEGSINSARISIKVRQSDEMETMLAKRFFVFLCRHAEDFLILRRKPIHGYDLSFLVTSEHCTQLTRPAITDFIVQIIKNMDNEIQELHYALKTRNEIEASAFMQQFCEE